MAIVTNTFLTYDAKGIREDLANTISNISPEETPFMSNARGPKKAVTNRLSEWQTDALATADGANAALEGDDLSGYEAVTATVRVGNYTQISRKTVIISGTEEVVDKAGRSSELAYQVAKKAAELKRDQETIFLRNQSGTAGNSTTKQTLASMGAWVKTNVDKDALGTNPSWSSGVPTLRTDSTALRTFTEIILKNVLQLGWTAGADFSIVMTGPVNKQRASGFNGIATRFKDVPSGQASIVGAADVYVGDFGQVTIVPNRFSRERDAWFLDRSMYGVRYLRPYEIQKMAKTGDAEKRMMLAEYTLAVSNELGLGLAADLITS